jgi:hypothetical protein
MEFMSRDTWMDCGWGFCTCGQGFARFLRKNRLLCIESNLKYSMFIEFEIKQKDNKFFSKTLDFGFGFLAGFVPELTK